MRDVRVYSFTVLRTEKGFTEQSELVLSVCGAAVGESGTTTGIYFFRDEAAPPPLHPHFHLGAEARWDVFAHSSLLLVMFFCFSVLLLS